jgi:ribosome recycling factor
MKKSLELLNQELGGIRTGKASPRCSIRCA